MLIRSHDAATDAERRAFLDMHDFGTLVAPGRRDAPILAPTHFVLQGDLVLTHFARPNPVFQALDEDPRASLWVVGDYVYVPSEWNRGEEGPPGYGVTTSYYTAIRLDGRAEIVDDPQELADLLNAMLARFEPGSDRRPVDATRPPDAPLLRAIRGVRLRVERVEAKMKYGGNRPVEHRLNVAERLAERDGRLDAAAREHVLRRMG